MIRENSALRISADGLDLVKDFEASGQIVLGSANEHYLTAYQDSAGVWTIGYGHTGLHHNDGTVKRGRVIKLAEAEALLRGDMAASEADVRDCVCTPLFQYQFDALVSFQFNTGALRKSSLLRYLNAGSVDAAANEFGKWIHAGGRVLNGLIRRRLAEQLLFKNGNWRECLK